MVAMKDEIIKLMEKVSRKTGLAESTLSLRFGNRYAAERIRRGNARIDTCEAFKAWLEDQLREVA